MKIRETEGRAPAAGFSIAVYSRVRAVDDADPLAQQVKDGTAPAGTAAVPDDAPEHDWQPDTDQEAR